MVSECPIVGLSCVDNKVNNTLQSLGALEKRVSCAFAFMTIMLTSLLRNTPAFLLQGWWPHFNPE
jgi:hypothetical protein